jgi:hypothetical protein
MPPNTTPIFTLTPVAAVGQVSVANPDRDGTGTIATIYTPGSDGGRIEYVRVQATGTTTDGVVRLFIHNGTNARLWKELLVAATTPSTTVAAFSTEFVPTEPLVLPTGYSLRASTHNAETFNVFVHGGDF